MVLSDNGQVYAFGSNENGQLGLSDNNDKNEPKLISSINSISQIATGNQYSLVLSINGQIYSFGSNSWRQLGLGDDHDNKNKPTEVMLI